MSHDSQHLGGWTTDDRLCAVPPSPQLRRRLRAELDGLRRDASPLVAPRLRLHERTRVGLNDGLNIPGSALPLGAPALVARRAARLRPPLRGSVRVLVVLAGFADAPILPGTAARVRELFFSEGVMEHGSVRDYFSDVSRGKVRITGEVLGPVVLPRPAADYTGSENGVHVDGLNARTMADDALTALDAGVDLGPYDNDHNGFVDAYVVVHSGRGAEESGAPTDVWSHKWVLPEPRRRGGVSVFGYLTIPEDAKLGVCAHELGHLLFGWPDLYDDDASSRGVGDFCLMAAGSWGLGGLRPVHPSAWCKATQGWAPVSAPTRNRSVTLAPMTQDGRIHRLWQDGRHGDEYFLVEHRERSGYDASLPSAGLLVWHVDEAVEGNSDERHPQVALVQADGRQDLERDVNDGDDGDPFPGSGQVRVLDGTTTPSTLSYGGLHTCVALRDITPVGQDVRAGLRVRCPGGAH
jgi:immune inhibitor A